MTPFSPIAVRARQLAALSSIHEHIGAKLGNRVRCETCGRVAKVDPAVCLRSGWPECHGYTMTLLPRSKRT